MNCIINNHFTTFSKCKRKSLTKKKKVEQKNKKKLLYFLRNARGRERERDRDMCIFYRFDHKIPAKQCRQMGKVNNPRALWAGFLFCLFVGLPPMFDVTKRYYLIYEKRFAPTDFDHVVNARGVYFIQLLRYVVIRNNCMPLA